MNPYNFAYLKMFFKVHLKRYSRAFRAKKGDVCFEEVYATKKLSPRISITLLLSSSSMKIKRTRKF